MDPIQIKLESNVSDGSENNIYIYEGCGIKQELNLFNGSDGEPQSKGRGDNVVSYLNTSIKQEDDNQKLVPSDSLNGFGIADERQRNNFSEDIFDSVNNSISIKTEGDSSHAKVSPKRRKRNASNNSLDNTEGNQKLQKRTSFLKCINKLNDISKILKPRKSHVKTTEELPKSSRKKSLKRINVNNHLASKNIDIIKNTKKLNNIENTKSDSRNIPKQSLTKKNGRNLKSVNKEKEEIKKADNSNKAIETETQDDSSHARESPEQQAIGKSQQFYAVNFLYRYCATCDKIHNPIGKKSSTYCSECRTRYIFVCKKCKRRNSSYSTMSEHIVHMCYPKKVFKCDHCDYKTNVKQSFVYHVQYRHAVVDPKDYHVCSKCGKGFKVLKGLKNHEKYCKSDHRFKCNICSYETKHKSDYMRHMNVHLMLSQKEKDVPDNNSGGKVAKQIIPTEKKKVSSGIQKWLKQYCSGCEKTTVAIKGHKRCKNCNGILSFRCGKCSADFGNSRQRLYYHAWRNHLPNKREQCPNCRKYFSNHASFFDHRRMCTKTPHLQCNHCPYRAKVKYSLAQHIHSRHMQSLLVKCDQCGGSYKNVYVLKEHKKYCNKEPRLKCDHCAYKTFNKCLLARHMLLKHVDLYTNRTLECKVCNRKISNVYKFEEHIAKCGKRCVRN